MKLMKKLLKNTYGYTLAELLLVITIFAIGVVPIYKMVVSAAKMQKAAEETYKATLHGQNLLQNVKKQIEADVKEEYKFNRGLSSTTPKAWLDPMALGLDPSLVKFLEIDSSKEVAFNKKYNTDTFLYEVHIWPMIEGKPKDTAISFTAYRAPAVAPTFDPTNTSAFTKVEIQDIIKEHFFQKDSLLWTDLGGIKPIGIGEITYEPDEKIKIKANGIKGYSIGITPIVGYTGLSEKTKLTYQSYSELAPTSSDPIITHELIIEDNIGVSNVNDVIQLSIDLTTFPAGIASKIIRIENKTKATVVVPVYNEKDLAGVQIYPIQSNLEGNIIVENRNKLEPSKNFIVGIIVRDAYNSTFGEDNRILSKIVDVYSYDYSKQ